MRNKIIVAIGIIILGFAAMAFKPPIPAEYVCLEVSSETWNASVIINGTCYHYLTIEGEVKSCNHENCGQCKPTTCTDSPPVCRYQQFSDPIEL